MTTAAALAVQFLVLAGRVGGDQNPQGPEPTSISPGLTGFLATFGLAVAAILLFLSMTRHLRKVEHSRRRQEAEGRGPAAPTGGGQDDDRAEESSLEDPGSDEGGEEAPRHR